MIKIIVHAFIEAKQEAVVEVLFASADEKLLAEKMEQLTKQFPDNYLAIYDLPLDTDLSQLNHYPIGGHRKRGV